MPHLPRVPAFPIAGEGSILTAAGAALKIPAKERNSPLIGQQAPEILAKDHLGRIVSLHATIALGRPIVLYFFPLAGSPHCTKESCSFRDAVGTSPIFNDLNAVVIGISQDPPSRSKRFVDEHHLGFRILHDENRQIMDAWGVGRGLLGLIDGRCTFIIDHQGVVRAMLDGVWDYQGHRNFAEKWLCRIEHELSGRERFYMEHQAEQGVACDDISRNVKVVYGDAVPSRGIAAAPRHGAAPTATKKKHSKELPSQPKSASLSIAAEANASGSIRHAKSKRNLKTWLRPSPNTTGVYDEPLHVDYKLTNRSLDDVPRSKRISPTRAARSTEKLAARVRSMRLDDPSDPSAGVSARDFADRSSHSRQESGSGSGWATPSTISARSISTGETSHTCPGPDSRDSAHAATLAAALKTANKTELQRSTSAARRRIASEGASGVQLMPSARSSSLLNKASIENAALAAVQPAEQGEKEEEEEEEATLYANGNIARMPLKPATKAERSVDSKATVLDRRNGAGGHRSNDVSLDSNYSASTSSLPVPPRPATRNGAGVGGNVMATASARLQKQTKSPTLPEKEVPSLPSSPILPADQDDGYATDRGSSSNLGLGINSTTPPKQTTFGRTQSCPLSKSPRRILPQQSPVPSYAPPSLPSSHNTSSRSLRLTNTHPSPSATLTSNPYDSLTTSSIDHSKGLGMERRLSNTPSLTPSAISTFNDGGSVAGVSEYGDYSPSIAGSTHTFGGLED